MSQLYQHSLKKLEIDQVLTQLSTYAGSAEGKAACLALQPSSDLEDVRVLLSETTYATSLSEKNGYPSFQELSDVMPELERAQMGGSLNPKELLGVAGVLRCTRKVKAFADVEDTSTPLSPYFLLLKPNKHLEDSIFNSILSEEDIADSASPELSDIRRKKRIQSARIKESLQKVVTSSLYSKYLQEQIITIRQGRYVVPVKSEFKNNIPGLVHDVSATGSTCFIEPISAVSANNELRELELAEQKEIERILAQLSAMVASHAEDIRESQTALVRLDAIFAKARLAYKMRAWAPEMNDSGKILLRNARHPLLDSQKAVPISLSLGADFDTMIITGPNTGGKTVTLKTIGLLTLMAECGLHIPAGEGSCLSTFDMVLADIGDEQSIAQSLSTFSSHMRTIIDIVSQCDNRSLVLFDELGAGTDPAEGAALAIALIEFCRSTGSCVAATTHYAELKLYAMRTQGVMNASCEFDVETLQPTYKLLIGIPGKSNAFAISEKLGLPSDIIKKASDLVGQNDKDFEEVLSQLESQRKQMENARVEAERLRSEIVKIKEDNDAAAKMLAHEREKALEQARLEAKRIIDDAREAANAATLEIKALKKQLSEGADTHGINQRQAQLRRDLNAAEDKLHEGQSVQSRPKPSRDILIGDTVELLKLGTKASVLAIHKDGSYELQAGILKLTAKADEIYLIENENPYKATKVRPAHSGREMQTSVLFSEIDLRGMDSVEAICVLDRYLDEAMRSNLPTVRIIHGKGTGALRAAVQQALRMNKFIKKFRLGIYGEGEDGVTIAEFK